MTLSAGAKLGPYEILEPIGAGGMGEVYKATDTRLERTVAIKVLPSHVSDHPQVRERFEREARTISQLNHPHICTLHDVGRENGVDFLVMEHIEGETVAERLQKGPLPVEEALKHAIEIADALDKAHRQGVVHRDLKPGNIMLTKSGAKLLDFGLAKTGVAGSGPDLSGVATEAQPLTEQGAILGTFQYMAPEQLEGKEADARTDIFAFGAVLYETLTGQRAFHGKSQASLITSIMGSEPSAISSIQSMTPPLLDHVVKRCLAKDPDERWQSASDVMRELKWITGEGSSTTVLPSAKARSRPAHWIAIGFAAGAILAGLGVWSLVDPDPPPAVPRHLSINLPAEAPYQSDRLHALSPDGTQLAYVAATEDGLRLYIRSLDQLDVTPLAGTENAAGPFFSPDGEWVGFFEWPGGKLKKINVRGGPPMTLSDTPALLGASWAEDDHIVFAGAPSESGVGLYRVPARGGTPEVLTTPDLASGETMHRWPQVLPGEKAILFTVTGGGSNADRIAVLSLETGEYRTVIEAGYYGKYVPTGHIVYALGGTLMAAPFNLAKLQITGPPAPVLQGVRDNSGFALANFDFSEDGSLVYLPDTAAGRATLVAVDRTGGEVQALVAEPLENPRGIRVSPDGRRLALITGSGGDVGDLWVYPLDGRPPTRLTFAGSDGTPVWVQDGSQIAFSSTREDGRNLYKIPSDGSNLEPELLLKSPHVKYLRAWSQQTEELIFDQGGPGDIMTIPIEGEHEPRALVTGKDSEGLSSLSSDGRWLAYVSMVTGRYEVWVRPYPGPGAPTRISPNGGLEPVWGPGDEELFYLEGGNKIMAVKIFLEPELRFEAPKMLFEGPYSHNVAVAPTYDVGPDGRFIMAKPIGGDESERREFVMILNWFEELKKLVPTDN